MTTTTKSLHVTQIRNGSDVWGHETSHCDEGGCAAGADLYLADRLPRHRTQPSTCIVRDPVPCERPARGKGLCDAHRKQLARTGALTLVRDRGAPRVMLPWRVPEYVVEVVRQVAEQQGREPGDVVEDALLGLMPEGD